MKTLPLLAGVWLMAIGLVMATDPQAVQSPAADTLQPPPKPTLPPGTPAEQVRTLTAQFDAAYTDFRKRIDAAKTDEERQKLFPLMPVIDDYAALMVEIAEKHPKDPVAFDALLWAARYGRTSPQQKDSPYAKAKTVLVRDYLMDPRIGPFCLALWSQYLDPAALSALRDVLTKNPSKQAQAQAAFALTHFLKQRAAAAEFVVKATPEQIAQFEQVYGNGVVVDLKQSDPAALRKEREELLERLSADKDHATTLIDLAGSKVTLGELADRELFALRHLQPGKPAPETEGEDIDGVPFKLSDYRGKVVLLSFWGHW